ncbi:MAG: Co2+/Mg2+ efflux protein ApaG [Pseudomonadota bacterium]
MNSTTSEQTYEATTRGILVRVTPRFLPEQSDASISRYVWAYDVEIENHSEQRAQLVTRTWVITDGRGKTEHVHGPGVVGETPELQSGESFSYTSGCPLTTDSGFMRGHYTMVDPDGGMFDVAIPTFSLDMPQSRKSLN